ncbi:MAG: hypothetical protein HKL80_11330 [Acidimicrobiales bacterium]|nr:hypothetical protein [Acidimicrobiales bacterium]
MARLISGGDPVNASDPMGLSWCDSMPVGCGEVQQVQQSTVSSVKQGFHQAVHYGDNARHYVAQHGHGIAQIATVAIVGAATAYCVAATDGLCVLALPFIGGATGGILYMESGGQHTIGGFILAIGEGGIAGSIALICTEVCSFLGSLALGGAVVNGLVGAGFGMWDYSHSGGCHSISGYAKAAAGGAAEGGIPWDSVVKAFSGGE